MDNETIDCFVIIIHGTNVSSVNRFYPIETKYQSVIFHSRPFQVLKKTHVDKVMANPCRYILGSCPKIPTAYTENSNKKYVMLPPLGFGVKQNEIDEIKPYIGLYYMKIKMNNYRLSEESKINPDTEYELSCDVVVNEKILDNEYFLRTHGNVDGDKKNYITYSQIYKYIDIQCLQRNISPKNVVLIIMSCQSRDVNYIDKYSQKITNLLPRNEMDIPAANIFSIKNPPSANMNISPTIIIYEKGLKNWNALANIKFQGCGLNVLSYFEIIDENFAREKTMCLNIQGTSIFKIVDYINNSLIQNYNINWPGYLIIRMDINDGFKLLTDFMSKYPKNKFAIIFKMYNELFQKNTQNYSQMGHTVALYKNVDNSILFIDPQAEIQLQLVNFQQSANMLKNPSGQLPYGNSFKYIDIIFTVSDSQKPFANDRPIYNFKDFQDNSIDFDILERPKGYIHGGKVNFKNKKTKKHNTRIKKTKKYNTKVKTTKAKRKINRKKNYYGGEIPENDLDEFEKFMIETDKKNNIPTVLDKIEINDI